MKNTVSVHVINRFQKLEHVVFDSIFWKIMPTPFDCIIKIHIHELKYKC